MSPKIKIVYDAILTVFLTQSFDVQQHEGQKRILQCLLVFTFKGLSLKVSALMARKNDNSSTMGDLSKRKKIYCFMFGFMWQAEFVAFSHRKELFFIALLVNKRILSFQQKHFVVFDVFFVNKLANKIFLPFDVRKTFFCMFETLFRAALSSNVLNKALRKLSSSSITCDLWLRERGFWTLENLHKHNL